MERVAGLDGLRGVAVGAVVLHHASAYLVPSLWGKLAPGGFLGVDLFMVLSGYLITSILANQVTRERWVGRFYRRRAVRLLPAVVALLAVLGGLLALGVLGAGGDFAGSAVATLLYVFNWARLEGLPTSAYLDHLWSLSVEEQFYIVWPLVFAASGRRALPIAAVGVVLAAAWRAHLFVVGDWSTVYIRTDARADALLIGCCLAMSPRFRQVMARGAPVGLVVFGGAVLAMPRESEVLFNGGFTVIALACAAMVAGVVETGWGQGLLERTSLTTVGVVSYGVYLWHYPVMLWVQLDLGWSGPGALVVGLGVTGAATWASWRMVEAPALRWKEQRARTLPCTHAEDDVILTGPR